MRRALHVLGWSALVVIVLPLLLLAVVLVMANTGTGRGLLERATAQLSGGIVQLQGLAGRFPDQLQLQRLTLRDRQGVWLQADAVTADWRPWQLLEERVRVTQLSAARVAMLRSPMYAARRSSTRKRSGELRLRLPVTVQVDRLELPQVQLGAALAGSAVTLRIVGGGRYRSLQSASLQLSASRLDQATDNYRVFAQLSARRADVRLDLAEKAGGPLANLLRLPQLGALQLQARFGGPRTALATMLDAHLGALQASASGTLDLPERAATLDLSVQALAMAPRPGLAWQRVSLTAHVRGPFVAPTTQAQLELTGLSAGALRLGALQAQLRGVGGGLALDATLADLTLPAPVGELLHHAPVAVRGQVQLTQAGGATVDLTLSHPLVTARARYAFGAQEAATLRAAVGSRGAEAGRAAGADTGFGVLTATLPQLAPWAALAQLNLRGRAALEAQIDHADAGSQLHLSAGVDTSGGDARWIGLLGAHTALDAQLSYSGERMQLLRSQLQSAHLQASAQGDDRGGVLDIGWRVAVPALGAWSAALPGRLTAAGRVQGSLPRVKLSASVDTTFTVRKAPAQLHLSLQALGLPQQPSGRLDVSGTLDRAPLTLAALLRAGAGPRAPLTLTLQQAAWRSAQLAGTLRLPRATALAAQGQLSLRISQLGDLTSLAGVPLQGDVAASVTLQGSGAASTAQLQLDGRNLALQGTQVTRLQVSGNIAQPLRAPRLALQLSADTLMRGVHTALTASITGAPAALQLRASASTVNVVATAASSATTAAATTTTATAASLAGTGTGTGTGAGAGAAATTAAPSPQLTAAAVWYQGRDSLRLTSFSAHYRGQTLRLLAPALIALRDGVSVDRLRLGLGPAQIQLQGRVTPQLDLHASVSDLTPAALSFALPQLQQIRAQGRADAELELHGALDAPTGRFTLSAGGLSSASGAARALPPGAIKVSAQLADGTADVNMTVDAGERMQLRASGRVPLRRDAPMTLKLAGRADLTLANSLLEASGQRVTGELGIQAQLAGTLAAPQARGQLTLMQVSLQDYPRGLSLSDLSATVEATGSQVQLHQLSARAGSGTLSASGSIDLSRPGMPVQLQISAHNAQPLKSDLLTANLNMDLRLTGELLRHDLRADGTVRINKATINIPNALPPSVAELKVIRPGEQAPPPPLPVKPLIARMNLSVNAPTGIFVRGRGLNVEVGGTVHATGNSTTPNISGGFDLINGTFDLAGSTLNFSAGRVSFNGTGLRHKIDPTLDFTATTYSGGIAATLTVGGYADAPVITLSSSPQQLPQDEILARLLFGESVAQLTPLQIAGIGAALVTMTGAGGGGFNPLTTVQHALGLNRLAISGGTSASTATPGATSPASTGAIIEAGRYISNRVYVGARQGTNGLTQAQVQVDLTRQWKLQTTLSTGGGTVQGATPENDPGSSVGMSYQFEY